MSSIDPYIGQLLDDRYEIIEKIGEGGMSIVYRAICHRLNRYVALKVMRDELASDQEFKNRFFTESHAIAMLSHPNIAAVYDVSNNSELEYIVMELIDGITLKQYIDKKERVQWNEAVHFSRQIAKALSHAHNRGIIHRDIKPLNVMLLRDGTIKVTDFGIAALENEAHENNGQAIGSIHYISPEQARGETPDLRCDIYSLGVVIYEMLTGVIPYSGDSLNEVAIKQQTCPPVPIHEFAPDVPEQLEIIVAKAMNIDISRRYQTTEELLNDLDSFYAIATSEDNSQDETVSEEIDIPHENSNILKNRNKYRKNKSRSSRVSFFSGSLALLCFILFLFVFLWNFWLKDIFSPTTRIPLPDFTGQNYFALLDDNDISSIYNFNIEYVISDAYDYGMILSQDPKPGRSMMLNPSGINVDIRVCSGPSMISVPEVSGLNYREASLVLTEKGFKVEVENVLSDSVDKDLVITSSPYGGEKISIGSTVYIQVSSGKQVLYVEMPQLIGTNEKNAIQKIEAAGLCYAGYTTVTSDFEEGTVIGQNIPAFTQVEEHTGIFLQISGGR